MGIKEAYNKGVELIRKRDEAASDFKNIKLGRVRGQFPFNSEFAKWNGKLFDESMYFKDGARTILYLIEEECPEVLEVADEDRQQ